MFLRQGWIDVVIVIEWIVNAVKTRTIARRSTRGWGVAIGGGVVGASSPPLSHRNGWRSLGVPRSLIWPSTMHNKRALDGRLCRAVARLLVTMAWPPLGGSTRNTWQTRKQCARAALRRDFAHLGCAHANKLSPPLSLFSRFSLLPSLSIRVSLFIHLREIHGTFPSRLRLRSNLGVNRRFNDRYPSGVDLDIVVGNDVDTKIKLIWYIRLFLMIWFDDQWVFFFFHNFTLKRGAL